MDRNINPDGRGKYALIKLRSLPCTTARLEAILDANGLGDGVLDYGDTPDTEFFVIRIKDKYAGPALHAYAEAAKQDDMEYAAEVDSLAQAADRKIPKRIPD